MEKKAVLCNWCSVKLPPDSEAPFCDDCISKRTAECGRCHRPFTSLNEEGRCKACQKKYEKHDKNPAKKRKRHVEESDDDDDTEGSADNNELSGGSSSDEPEEDNELATQIKKSKVSVVKQPKKGKKVEQQQVDVKTMMDELAKAKQHPRKVKTGNKKKKNLKKEVADLLVKAIESTTNGTHVNVAFAI